MNEKQITLILTSLGLSQYASQVYLQLLQIGEANISEIVLKTGLHRPTVYQAVAELEQQGFLTKILKGKRNYFLAESPDKLQKLSQDLQQNLDKAVVEMQDLYQAKKFNTYVRFYEGKKGIKQVFADLVQSLNKGDIFYRFSSAQEIKKADTYLPQNYRKIRDKKQLERFVIGPLQQTNQKKSRMERQIKAMPEEFADFKYDVTEVIYGNKVAFIDYNTKTALVIDNPKIAQFQMHIFKALYKRLS